MDLYQVTFTALVISSCCLAWTQHGHKLQAPPAQDAESEAQVYELHSDLSRFRKNFIPVYLLVMGSDWLQVCARFPSIKILCHDKQNRENMSMPSTSTKEVSLNPLLMC